MSSTDAPSITSPPADQKIRIGYEIHFECSVSGNPRPTVSWQFERRDLDFSSGKYIVNQLDFSHTLTIEKAEKSDSGIYSCLGNNKYGSKSASVRLDVNGLHLRHQNFSLQLYIVVFGCVADLVVDAAPAFKTVLLDANDTLSCMAGGYKTPQVVWKKDSRQLDFSSTSKLSVIRSGALVITGAGYNESGVYECEVSDKEGTWSVRQAITVTVRGGSFNTNFSSCESAYTSPDLMV